MAKGSGKGKGGGGSAESRFMKALREVHGKAGGFPLHSMSDVRAASGLSKDVFDRTALDLSKEGKVVMHFDDAALSRSPAKLATMVPRVSPSTGATTYYHAIALPRGGK